MLVLNWEQINLWLPLTRELSAKLTEGEKTTPPSKLRFATSPDKWRLFFEYTDYISIISSVSKKLLPLKYTIFILSSNLT